MITNKELSDILLLYRNGNITKPLFRRCISKIVEEVYQHPSYYFHTVDAVDIIRETTNLCVSKAEKFDEQRGKAIDFFITIVGCYLRQVRRDYKGVKRDGRTHV